MEPEPRFSAPRAVWPWDDGPAGRWLVACRFPPRPDLDDCAEVVVPPELDRAVPRRVAEFLAGRLCAREALRLLTGRPQVPGRGPDRAPQWPPGVVGSITHCGALALAMAGPGHRYRGLGIDVERLLGDAEAGTIAPQALSDDDRRRWGTAPDPVVVTLAFCAKESLFKALYPMVRRRFYFDAADLVDWAPEGRASLRLRVDLGGGWPAGLVLEVRHCIFRGHMLTRVSIPTGKILDENHQEENGNVDLASDSH